MTTACNMYTHTHPPPHNHKPPKHRVAILFSAAFCVKKGGERDSVCTDQYMYSLCSYDLPMQYATTLKFYYVIAERENSIRDARTPQPREIFSTP